MAQKVLKKSYTNAKSYQNGFYIIICFAFLIINIYFCKTKSNILFIIISYINTNTMKKTFTLSAYCAYFPASSNEGTGQHSSH